MPAMVFLLICISLPVSTPTPLREVKGDRFQRLMIAVAAWAELVICAFVTPSGGLTPPNTPVHDFIFWLFSSPELPWSSSTGILMGLVYGYYIVCDLLGIWNLTSTPANVDESEIWHLPVKPAVLRLSCRVRGPRYPGCTATPVLYCRNLYRQHLPATSALTGAVFDTPRQIF